MFVYFPLCSFILLNFFPVCSFITSCSFIIMVKIMFHIRMPRAWVVLAFNVLVSKYFEIGLLAGALLAGALLAGALLAAHFE